LAVAGALDSRGGSKVVGGRLIWVARSIFEVGGGLQAKVRPGFCRPAVAAPTGIVLFLKMPLWSLL
jgi:hypothetical protein